MDESDPRVFEGVALIRDRQWYEAHEVLEDPWREADPPRKHWLQGLIHGAVALEHLRRGNPRGAFGQWQKADKRLSGAPELLAGARLVDWRVALATFAESIALAERSRRHVARESQEGLPTIPPEESWPLP